MIGSGLPSFAVSVLHPARMTSDRRLSPAGLTIGVFMRCTHGYCCGTRNSGFKKAARRSLSFPPPSGGTEDRLNNIDCLTVWFFLGGKYLPTRKRSEPHIYMYAEARGVRERGAHTYIYMCEEDCALGSPIPNTAGAHWPLERDPPWAENPAAVMHEHVLP